ncbi:ATP-binding cassette domain-containing protein, partial [Bombilactobacillus bombi]|uniref:ATP-binding cassette domain-containing protein n=1 Tax=Bombilactobacillus bombi TaxID=1303590 RepID=UPI0015E61EAD
YTKANIKLQAQENKTATISELSGMIIFLVAFGGGMIMVAQGNTTMGSVTAIVQLVNFVVMPINELGLLQTKFQSAHQLAQKLFKILTITKTPDPADSHLPLTKSIIMRNISFQYPNSKNKVLKNVNVEFEIGKKYAIIGHSGAGKSTILSLLCKLYLPISGEILIDNNQLSKISTTWWYQQIALVSQEIFIFNSTIQENVTLGRKFTKSAIIIALKQAGLSEFLQESNYNLDYDCGENGSNLSGGQRQRLALARAFLQQRAIILLDEATSALDKKTAETIETQLLNNNNLTVIAITHQTKLSAQYDQILQLKHGQLCRLNN